MKHAFINIFLFGIVFCCVALAAAQNNNPQKRVPGQPVLFGKDIISTENDEFGATFTPDGNTCYFSLRSPSTITSNIMVICVSQFKNGKWSEPEIAPFRASIKISTLISPDGSKLFFISNRPVDEKKKFDTDIWVVEKTMEWMERTKKYRRSNQYDRI